MGGEVFKQKYFQQWEVKDLLRQAQLAGEERFQVLSPTLGPREAKQVPSSSSLQATGDSDRTMP